MTEIAFDIFRVEMGGVLWLESAADLEQAKTRVQTISAGAPGEYLVLNQRTGSKIFITGEAANAASASGAPSPNRA
jgi:hypothetical protein